MLLLTLTAALSSVSFVRAADVDTWRGAGRAVSERLSNGATSDRWSGEPLAEVAPADAVRFVPAGKTLVWRVKIAGEDQNQQVVRQASHAQNSAGASDPFSDPFGDKQQPPSDAQPEQDELLPFRAPQSVSAPSAAPEPVSLAPPSNAGANAGSSVAQNDPPPPPPASVFLSARSLRQQEEQPCDRVYNDRNCCAAADQCSEARRKLDDPITKISLDITPAFNPDSDDAALDAEEMNSQLGSTPHRVWKDRQGNVIGEGRMTDYRRGRVLIAGEDGQVEPLRFQDLSDDDLCFVTAWWGLPTECTLGDRQFAGRDWMPATFTWTASALCHKPIYFEEVQLERYGHSAGPVLQPLASGAHFFLNVAVLPYKMGINPPQECRYALGYYRPGSCAPWMVPPVPLSVRGGLMQAGAVLGGVYLIP